MLQSLLNVLVHVPSFLNRQGVDAVVRGCVSRLELYGTVVGVVWWELTSFALAESFFELVVFRGNCYMGLGFMVFYGCKGNAKSRDVETQHDSELSSL